MQISEAVEPLVCAGALVFSLLIEIGCFAACSVVLADFAEIVFWGEGFGICFGICFEKCLAGWEGCDKMKGAGILM